jgi:hypothetical protein
VRVGRDDPDLRVRAVRIVGYRFACSCGHRGQSRPTYALARAASEAHRRERASGEGVAALD